MDGGVNDAPAQLCFLDMMRLPCGRGAQKEEMPQHQPMHSSLIDVIAICHHLIC